MLNHLPSIHALAEKVGMTEKPTLKHCRALERLGWMQLIGERNRVRPVAIVPPDVERTLASEVRGLIEIAPHKGEQTTRAYVNWIISPTVRLIYNARPRLLLNTDTGQNLEYDIFADELALAIEYFGDQHFGPTKQFPDKDAYIERARRDRLKAELSEKNNIRLFIVTKRDLTLEGILNAIPEDIPRRTFDPKGPFIQMLEMIGRGIANGRDWDREQ